MMIVVPMLIQTLTFGWIFENLLDSKGTTRSCSAGALLGCRGRRHAVGQPAELGTRTPSMMPLGCHRHITVYDRVVVGSDGTPSALYAVDRAHAVVAEPPRRASSWRLGVQPGAVDGSSRGRRRSCSRRRRRPRHEACAATVQHLTSDRVRRDRAASWRRRPADALIESGLNPATLIVVGNRGLGAVRGRGAGLGASRDRASRDPRRRRSSRPRRPAKRRSHRPRRGSSRRRSPDRPRARGRPRRRLAYHANH